MANAKINYDEVRFVINDDATEVYVRVTDETPGRTPANFPGWHHKSFPITLSIIDIMELWRAEREEPMMWERLAPPGVGEISV